jgi:acetolactate synthase-1/2/3 large subunit
MPYETPISLKKTGGFALFDSLVQNGTRYIFGYPGGAILPLYDELYFWEEQNLIKHILTRHEQGAIHAADSYARVTGRTGVCFATSGPGATNTVTGLADAMMDSVPIVCLTGQVPTHMIGNDAFQEADIVGITRPCTKHNYLVKDVNQLAGSIHSAFYIAKHGRPGPVLVDIPKDIQTFKTIYLGKKHTKKISFESPKIKSDYSSVLRFVEMLKKSSKPIFYVGGGVVNSGDSASNFLFKLIKRTGFPCTQTLMGLGAFPTSDPQSLGMLGMHGTYEANLAMHQADLVICVGTWPVKQTIGTESIIASAKPVTVFVAPGPEVAKQTPVRPVTRA